MHEHEKLNYVEFSASDIPATKAFFTACFGWSFEDFGSEYSAFSGAGLNGGFFKSAQSSLTSNGAALLVFYSNNIEATLLKVEQSGGEIIKPIFTFPGGRRFHFLEPSGNEFAVWSDISL
ncbi:VOC family protein [Moritella sp. F3]|uniref:VOC family protein n=1 Tax=Moritella sp. F3 TaxID=2718882 RepID=UPI0018E176D9|nr:VOC family protein [Moritella sp. F3]GIC77521.1 glyoxalase [Moritella sp. F1]GIC79982.1 glyoxalase [Moritella sp. F3]